MDDPLSCFDALGFVHLGSLIIVRSLFEGNQPLQKSAIAGRRTTAPGVAARLPAAADLLRRRQKKTGWRAVGRLVSRPSTGEFTGRSRGHAGKKALSSFGYAKDQISTRQREGCRGDPNHGESQERTRPVVVFKNMEHSRVHGDPGGREFHGEQRDCQKRRQCCTESMAVFFRGSMFLSHSPIILVRS